MATEVQEITTASGQRAESFVRGATQRSDPVRLAIAKLKSAGFRITQPRIDVLETLNRCAQPVTIEQLRVELGAGKYDLMTVYRCVAALVKAGIVFRRGFFHNGTALYKMEIGQTRRYQVVCKITNRVQDLDEQSCEELRDALEAVEHWLGSRGYRKLGHIMEFFAVIPENVLARTDESSRLPGPGSEGPAADFDETQPPFPAELMRTPGR